MRFGPLPRITTAGLRERRDLVLVLVGAVVVRRERGELGRAGVDGLVGDAHAGREARGAHRRASVDAPEVRELARRRSRAASPAASRRASSRRSRLAASRSRSSTIWRIWSRNHGSMPVTSCRRSTDTNRRSAASSRKMRSGVGTAAARTSSSSPSASSSRSAGSQLRPQPAGLERAQRLLQRLGERAADRHHLADRLHLRAEHRRRARQLLERPARDLGDDVVDGRLERRRRLAGDVVAHLVEPVADRELGRDLRDREAGRLARERARRATRAGSSR